MKGTPDWRRVNRQRSVGAGQDDQEMLVILPDQFFQRPRLVAWNEREACAQAAVRADVQMAVEQDEMKCLFERAILIGHEQVAGGRLELIEEVMPGTCTEVACPSETSWETPSEGSKANRPIRLSSPAFMAFRRRR